MRTGRGPSGDAIATIAGADALLRERVGASRIVFEMTRSELDQLEKYKALHDCLHSLQLQLTAVVRAARAFPAERTPGRDLAAFLNQLQRVATRPPE